MVTYKIQTLTVEQVKEFIATADDNRDNQIRVKKDGTLYMSERVGAQDIEDLQFRYETYDAGNSYVGSKAAADSDYIQGLYTRLKKHWNDGRTGYIDF